MVPAPTDEEFSELIEQATWQLSHEGVQGLENVAITYADEPTPEQLQKLRMRGDQLLLGLYEGTPMTKRGMFYQMTLPDKITLFKLALAHISTDDENFRYNIRHTLWHEIAHFYGLDHPAIHALEQPPQ